MIALNNEDIPEKKDEQTVDLTMENPIETTSIPDTKENGTNTSIANGNITLNNTTINTPANRLFNVQFQQKTKYLREMWSQHKVKIDKDHSQLILICFLTCIGILCSVGSLFTKYWISDSNTQTHYGIWNVCWQEKLAQWSDNNDTSINWNETEVVNQTTTGTKWWCARQGVYDLNVNLAEKWRVDQVFASQGLLVCGTILYVFSVVMLGLAYKFIGLNRLNTVRNTLVISMFVQMIAFIMQLIGYFLFIFTDRASVSIALLFVYFGLAIFATNIINFITIEYKSYKIRQMTI